MNSIHKIGYWSGLCAFAATLSYCIVQALQVASLLSSPLDEKLIYGTSLCIVVPFVLEMLALHYTRPEPKRFWSHAALTFATLYAVFVTANYVVQLATVIPMAGKGRLEEVRVLQQTPHSLFWNFDALGYIFMGLATVAAIPVFRNAGRQKRVRMALIANGLVLPLICIVYFAPNYSEELLLIGVPWSITAPLSMLLLALNFKTQPKSKSAGEAAQQRLMEHKKKRQQVATKWQASAD